MRNSVHVVAVVVSLGSLRQSRRVATAGTEQELSQQEEEEGGPL